ncbi:hypothetical protein ACIBK8_25535 [Streptomyces sp. NPDC050161]|uniref:hypothetical protein n=1 Tax=Streptomyces sp. NPDC050161 TaxID=3365604 RepID=UPI0037A9227E
MNDAHSAADEEFVARTLRTATREQIDAARSYTIFTSGIEAEHVTDQVAVAYVQQRFAQGPYSGWHGFVASAEAEAHRRALLRDHVVRVTSEAEGEYHVEGILTELFQQGRHDLTPDMLRPDDWKYLLEDHRFTEN